MDVLTQDTTTFNKAQIEAIYATNANLLNDDSQDSVHMFGSEEGGKADRDVDIDNMVFTKYDLDIEGSVSGGDDMSYCSKRRSTGSMSQSYSQTPGPNYLHGHQALPPECCFTPQRQLQAYDHPMLSNSSNSLFSTNNSHRGGSCSFAAVEGFH